MLLGSGLGWFEANKTWHVALVLDLVFRPGGGFLFRSVGKQKNQGWKNFPLVILRQNRENSFCSGMVGVQMKHLDNIRF